ncbi:MULTISPECIES: hypothetical protein [Rhodomicrobium]|uniref:hypothetical protein n=1 Tax=Rhodomicrobium TaxID=1068 RepID=UPI000B4BB540|nr:MULTISPECIES: hypothetical protein [Rhodomicrobium]
MMRLRFPLAMAVLAGTLLAAKAEAAGPRPAPAAAMPDITRAAPPAEPPRQMRAGPVSGELTASAIGTPSSPGSSTFAQLKLSSAGTGKRGLAIELVAEAEIGEVVSVTGPDVTSEKKGGATLARIAGLREGRDRIVLVEFKLRAAAGNPANRLKLTLRAPRTGDSTAEDSVAIAWPVADCAGAYHAALTRIGADGGNMLRETWRAAAQPDKSMPRNWLFRPASPRRDTRRVSETAGADAKLQREVFIEAGELVSAGYDSALRQNGRYGWTISKVAEDLNKYFTQEPNPALCTGAIGFVAYYDERLAPLRQRAERLTALAGAARAMSREKAEALLESVRAASGGHPAWGGATLASLKPVSDGPEDDKALILALMRVGNFSKDRIAEVSAAPDGYAALRMLDGIGPKTGNMPAATREAMREAMSSIEAALRLGAAQSRYDRLWRGLNGSLQAIRDAHAKHCTCGS